MNYVIEHYQYLTKYFHYCTMEYSNSYKDYLIKYTQDRIYL